MERLSGHRREAHVGDENGHAPAARRTPVRMDADQARAAHHELVAALAGRPLVAVERFSTALRTGYTGPDAIEALRPALSIGCYGAWEPAMPGVVVAAEDRTRLRSIAERHGWLPRTRHDAARHLVQLDRPPVVFTWYATHRLRELAGPGAVVTAIDGDVRATIEAKHLFDDLLRAAGVPAVARVPCVHTERLPSLPELRRAVRTERVVVQAGYAGEGRGTVIVSDEEDMARAARLLGPYRVAAYVSGWPATIAVLSVPDRDGGVRVYADRPSHSSTGIAELGIDPTRSAGNDWSRPWPAPAAALLIECAERIAVWAWRRFGIAGLFCLDAILTPAERVYLSAIKWRHQESTEMSAVNQQSLGLPPFVLAHLSVMLGGQVRWLGDPQEHNQLSLLRATQSGGPFYVKVRLRREDGPVRVSAVHGPGIYRLDPADRLMWVRHGAHPGDAYPERGEFLLANLPGPDVVCHPGADIATYEGIAEGEAHPFDGPHSAALSTERVLAAIRDLFLPYDPPRA
ncbi:hypothetical protein ABZ897_58770 [Nonomuraea sp. NPDC046802]|uniref:hypothetical protein n=1 Tax=Nonomuraea sp. NPDC046802 TaxID=3154919 RepID=UPI0033E4CCD2